MSTLFLAIYNQIANHRVISLFILVILISVSGWFASQLKLSEDISKILPDTEKINNMNFVYSNSKFLDKVVFNISIIDTTIINPDLLAEFADKFTDSLNSSFIPGLIQSIDFAPDQTEMLEIYNTIYNNLPIFLSEEDYKIIDTIISTPNIHNTIASNYSNLMSPVSFVTKKLIAQDPLHLTPIALQKFSAFNFDNDFQTYNKYFISNDHCNLILLVTPASTNKTSNNNLLFNGIDNIIEDLSINKFKNIRVDYFGNAVVALGNANQIKKDIIVTVTLALLVLIIVITLFFRSKRTFIIVFLPVVFGALVSLAMLFILKKEVSAISLGIGSVLLGISVDYALHIYSHFRQYGSRKLIFKNLSTPVILSSITTASAFLSLYFVNSEALNDLGLFAAISILSAAVFSLIVLPHFIGTNKEKTSKYYTSWIDKLAAYRFSDNAYLKSGIILATIVLLIAAQHVSFDADMMKSNYMSDKLKQVEQRLNAVTNLSKKTIYIVSHGKDLNEAIENNTKASNIINKLKSDQTIQNSSVINNIFPSQSQQLAAINRWNEYWDKNRNRIIDDISIAAYKTGFSERAFSGFSTWLNNDFSTISPNSAGIIQQLILDKFIIQTDTLSAVINVIKVNSSDEDINKVYNAFSNEKTSWIIDKRLITSEFITILKDNFNKLIIISLSFVFVILLIAYGRIELTIITMIPMIFSWIWTVGIMGLFGIEFNIFNVIILTFIFGLGIDYSIFIMRGLLIEYKYGIHDISSYKVSVILSGITTLLGIGVLIFADHPALRSIATMSIIGILSVIFITFTLLPAIFKWLVRYKMGLRNRPVTLLDFIFSLWALFVFVSGSLFLSVFSLLLKITPLRKTAKKIIIHKLFRYLTWFMIYMNFLSKKPILNPDNEDYKNPAIIITNHQSHIDLMLMLLLNYRVVVLSSRKNITNFIYGVAIRYAGFIEVDSSYEVIVDKVKAQTDMGYSVVIFPEGHRSDTGILRRFHKGAFYLANELNLDILPIIIYGQKELLKKSEFILKRGKLITKFLPRIALSDGDYGNTLREQTKNVKKYFGLEYNKVAKMLETPDYYSDFIKKNYLYKGPVLEWYTRIKLKLEQNYNIFNEIIPEKCKITELGCGYGYLAYMLNLVSANRRIIGIDYDADKINVATHCAIKNDNVNFIAADICEIEPDCSDVFILNDVLHYMPKHFQIMVIESCIEKLNPGGLIIIRDADKDLGKRHLGTRITELFSTGLGFNKTKFELEFVSRSMIEDISEKHNLSIRIIDNTKLTSNLIYMLSLP
ncbi:MAG: MMPL family transporter [Bacteroidetes bacterium]|nr:MMPL family transporter [Bacteroidota bacterium]MBL6943313.1 MMPL family transporter [Bacteroidales bacterium]